MSEHEHCFTDGKRYLLSFDRDAQLQTTHGPATTRACGELILCCRGDHPKNRGFYADRLTVAASGLNVGNQSTGKISVIGKTSGGGIDLDTGAFRMDVNCDFNHESLDQKPDPGNEGCYYLPNMLPSVATITGDIAVTDHGILAQNLRISVVCAADCGEAVKSLVIEIDEQEVHPLLPLPNSTAAKNRQSIDDLTNNTNNCDSSLEVNRRRLTVQPVGFRISATDPSPSGFTAAAQIGTAQTIWGKCCIDIVMNPIEYITNAALKTSSNLTDIRAAYTHPDPNVIEIFFVDNLLPANGGGNAGAIGVATQKIVCAEPNAGNPVLTAHELGHALGLLHPGGVSGSDPGTVMAPTGGANNPGTDTVTHFMCTQISQPALQTLTTTCCLTHDIGDHYIRDFPEDVGNEPSDPLPPGRTRYSMSNVWNRLTNTPGGVGPNGPDHEHPARFESDGVTPRTNYLHAKVEQIENLRVRNAEVKFFIKHPGSGGGALTLLGQTNVSLALGVGSPDTVSIGWTVPPGTPNHSCVFAVVRSPAEPDGDQSGLNWNQFETLSRNDNDWAQRNLNITNTSSNNNGSNNTAASAPIIIRIPASEAVRELPLILNIDASATEGLTSLALEIPGKERFDIQPGDSLTLQPSTPVVPGEDYILVAHAVIPAGMESGDYSLNLDPIVGKTALAGYACCFRMSPHWQILGQFFDTAVAGLTDLVKVTEIGAASALLGDLRAFMKEGVEMPVASTVKFMYEHAGHLKELTEHLLEYGAGKAYALLESLERWLEVNEKWNGGKGLTALSALSPSVDFFQRVSMISASFYSAKVVVDPKPDGRDTLDWRQVGFSEKVSIVLDKLELTYPKDAKGVHDLQIYARVEGDRKTLAERVFPEKGTYQIQPGTASLDLYFEEAIYRGPVQSMTLELEAMVSGADGRWQRVAHYARQLPGDPKELRGRYLPGDEKRDPESGGALQPVYRVV